MPKKGRRFNTQDYLGLVGKTFRGNLITSLESPSGHSLSPARWPDSNLLIFHSDPPGIRLALLPWPINLGLVVDLPGLEPHRSDSLVLIRPIDTAPHSWQKAKPPADHSLWLGLSFLTQAGRFILQAALACIGWKRGAVLQVVPFLGKLSTNSKAASEIASLLSTLIRLSSCCAFCSLG